MTLDIVSIIDKSPLTHFSSSYKSKLINKIKENFTEIQQQLYLANFYCYLEYDTEKDFVINLDDIWKWIGYERKDHGKRTLKKHFNENENFIIKNEETISPKIEENKTYEKKQNLAYI